MKRQNNSTEVQKPSGLFREYAAYRVALESATKVVKEFENPTTNGKTAPKIGIPRI